MSNLQMRCMSCRKKISIKDMPNGITTTICRNCHEICQLEDKLIVAAEQLLFDEGFREEQISEVLEKASEEEWHLGSIAEYVVNNFMLGGER